MIQFTFPAVGLFERINIEALIAACLAAPQIAEQPGIEENYKELPEDQKEVDEDIESITLTFQNDAIQKSDVMQVITVLDTPPGQGTMAVAEAKAAQIHARKVELGLV